MIEFGRADVIIALVAVVFIGAALGVVDSAFEMSVACALFTFGCFLYGFARGLLR